MEVDMDKLNSILEVNSINTPIKYISELDYIVEKITGWNCVLKVNENCSENKLINVENATIQEPKFRYCKKFNLLIRFNQDLKNSLLRSICPIENNNLQTESISSSDENDDDKDYEYKCPKKYIQDVQSTRTLRSMNKHLEYSGIEDIEKKRKRRKPNMVQCDSTVSDTPKTKSVGTDCFCNKKNMKIVVQCENLACKITWFHGECVGIPFPKPKGYVCMDCKTGRNPARLFRSLK